MIWHISMSDSLIQGDPLQIACCVTGAESGSYTDLIQAEISGVKPGHCNWSKSAKLMCNFLVNTGSDGHSMS